MINPNKLYKATQTGTISKIDSHDSYTNKFYVDYGRSGAIYHGYVSDIPNFKRFKVGDRVKCSMQFSIVLDTFLIKSVRKVKS